MLDNYRAKRNLGNIYIRWLFYCSTNRANLHENARQLRKLQISLLHWKSILLADKLINKPINNETESLIFHKDFADFFAGDKVAAIIIKCKISVEYTRIFIIQIVRRDINISGFLESILEQKRDVEGKRECDASCVAISPTQFRRFTRRECN